MGGVLVKAGVVAAKAAGNPVVRKAALTAVAAGVEHVSKHLLHKVARTKD